MNKMISAAFLAAGVVLALFGFNEMNSATSDISRMLPARRPIGRFGCWPVAPRWRRSAWSGCYRAHAGVSHAAKSGRIELVSCRHVQFESGTWYDIEMPEME